LGGQISSLPGQYWISSPDPIKERLEMVLIAQGARIAYTENGQQT